MCITPPVRRRGCARARASRSGPDAPDQGAPAGSRRPRRRPYRACRCFRTPLASPSLPGFVDYREEDRAPALPLPWRALGESLVWDIDERPAATGTPGATMSRRSDLFGHRQQVVARNLARQVGVDLVDVPVGFLHQLILGVSARDITAIARDRVGHHSTPS